MVEEKKLVIPESANSIPLEEFFQWYDAVLKKDWNTMSNDDKTKYFKDLDLEKIKNKAVAELKRNGLKDVSIKDIRASFSKPVEITESPPFRMADSRWVYYRIIEFQKLESDIELLQAMVRRFFSQKAVNKMLHTETLSDWLGKSKV